MASMDIFIFRQMVLSNSVEVSHRAAVKKAINLHFAWYFGKFSDNAGKR
jgi:hypothetical protein